MDLENTLYKLLYDVKIETPARSILESICQQTQKDIALTDRQYALVVEKLKPFESELDGVLIEHIPTRMPYPYNEDELNGENYDAAVAAMGGTDDHRVKLFWDVN